ncbi:MAG: hypothetical protein EOM37_10435 [Proteobacteria bacterium]|nr:hypothetical protein [Pseudomonadota bacterium]
MSHKIRRTMTIDRSIDTLLKEQSRTNRWSYSRTVNQALNEFTKLDHDNLKKLRRLSGVLEVETSQILNNLMKRYLVEVEDRKQKLDPASIFVEEMTQFGRE